MRLAISSSTIGCMGATANPAAVAAHRSSKSGKRSAPVFIVAVARSNDDWRYALSIRMRQGVEGMGARFAVLLHAGEKSGVQHQVIQRVRATNNSKILRRMW